MMHRSDMISSAHCHSLPAFAACLLCLQGENVCHGLCCRLEKLRCDMFAVLNTYYASRADQYKVRVCGC